MEKLSTADNSNRSRDHTDILEELRVLGFVYQSVKSGSIIISIMCPTVEAFDYLYALYTSVKLTDMFIKAYISDEYRQSVTLNVNIDEKELQQCRAQLLSTGETL